MDKLELLFAHPWDYYMATMMNFKAAYPTLAIFTLLGILMALIYLTKNSFGKKKKPTRAIFDINGRVKNPSWYSSSISFVVTSIITIPVYLVTMLFIGIVKLYFYWDIKRIENKYK